MSNSKIIIMIILVIILVVIGMFFAYQQGFKNGAQNNGMGESQNDTTKLSGDILNDELSGDIENQNENTKDYFWDYRDIKENAQHLSTAVFDDTKDDYIIVSKSNVEQNALLSLMKKYGDNEKAVDEFIQFYGDVMDGESPGGIEEEFSFDKEYPVYLEKDKDTIEMKYVAWHEDMFNGVWTLIKNDNYLDELKEDLEDAKELNDEHYISYYEEEIKETTEILNKMSNDPIIANIRKNCNEYNDMTIEERAYIGATYTTGYWDRPEDAHYSVNRVFIMNGDNRDTKAYFGHSRAKKIKIIIGEKEYILDLEDTPECQIFDLDYVTYDIAKPIDIKVELLESYDGDGYISESSYSAVSENSAYLSAIRFDVGQSIFVGGR